MHTTMHSHSKPDIAIADLDAVREFLLSGREIPRVSKATRVSQKNTSTVPVHNGIVRARTRSAAKA